MTAIAKLPNTPDASTQEEQSNTFARLNADGLIEIIDINTGAIVGVQADMMTLPKSLMVEAEVRGQTIMVQAGLSHDKIKLSETYLYSETLGDVIAQKMLEGHTLTDIAKMPNFPSHYTMARWRRHHPDFDEKIRFARKYRAELLRDEALSMSKRAENFHKDAVPGAKLRIETLKWAAEKDDPETYGTRVKVDGQVGLVQLVVETGIRRAGDVGAVDVTQYADGGADTQGTTGDTPAVEAVGDEVPEDVTGRSGTAKDPGAGEDTEPLCDNGVPDGPHTCPATDPFFREEV